MIPKTVFLLTNSLRNGFTRQQCRVFCNFESTLKNLLSTNQSEVKLDEVNYTNFNV